MNTWVLMIVLVFMMLVIAGLVTYFGYHQSKQQFLPGYDEERMQHARENEQNQGDNFELWGIGLSTNVHPDNRPYGHLHAVPANMTPVADPVAPRVDIEHQVREDFLAPSERVFMTAEAADENKYGRHDTVEHFQDQRMHGALGAGTMRHVNAVNPADVEYAAGEPIASDIWNKISNREVRVPRRKCLQKTAKPKVVTIRAVTPDAEDSAMRGLGNN
ncbi:hypothetical protein COCMIDRAFT_6619 [Bipolaris oryzae ATCC 44560]|uniref:Uncharacterized protein n=1 Tax=Bipolaris oryzae ATCC 44560 TaxID=930090 RepID=W6Z1X1_COCMI|nr:uncharacterized protein COCMIDRAFT_6619 [Bipolaris oryzae ATCC 44560]EUC43980.1 hypothetical protein COCMIDRAFT_6619 [Bipolaris oryzae ATCC 44560]